MKLEDRCSCGDTFKIFNNRSVVMYLYPKHFFGLITYEPEVKSLDIHKISIKKSYYKFDTINYISKAIAIRCGVGLQATRHVVDSSHHHIIHNNSFWMYDKFIMVHSQYMMSKLLVESKYVMNWLGWVDEATSPDSLPHYTSVKLQRGIMTDLSSWICDQSPVDYS